MTPVLVEKGDRPVILGQPHGGTDMPDAVRARLNERGQRLDDTDWHISQLYDGLVDDITVVKATFHRYVIDANRDPTGQSLYPGQNTTTLCPTTDFDGEPIWNDGSAPSAADIAARQRAFHTPYHEALAAELERIKSLHGFAILYDCHSIRSNIPYLFAGQLPVFNIGTNDGVTCAPVVQEAVHRVCRNASEFDCVQNGRFKGGWTTRHYGLPSNGVHAIQMELAQRSYMHEHAPWAYSETRAHQIRPYLSQILSALKALSLSDLACS
jgi:formiminoglutamase